jgi:hypothetical protein
MPTLLNTFFTEPFPGASQAAGPPWAGQVAKVSSLNDCQNSNCSWQRSHR